MPTTPTALDLSQFIRRPFVNSDGTLTRDATASLEAVQSRVGGPLGPIEAGAISFAPAGGIAADNMQAALQELDAEKADAASTALSLAGKQPLDATLTALAALTLAANDLIYATGPDAFAVTPLTAAARALLDDPNAATMRGTLGLGTLATQSGTFSGTHSGTSSGTNTGDQTITLTGDVTGSGTGSFAATVGSIGGKALSLAGSLTTAGAFASTFTMTGVTTVTFPTSGTLATVGGALGTPTSITLTNGTGLPISTGVSGLATGVAAFLATPSSANMAAMLTDETGTGANVFANTPTLVTPNIGAATGTSLAVTGALTSSGTAGIGYATGAGGTVTQLTSKSTGVTLNKLCGEITMNAAAIAGLATATFTLTNSAIGAGDVMTINHVAGGANLGSYTFSPICFAGGASIIVRNASAGSLSEAIVLRFAVIKGVTA